MRPPHIPLDLSLFPRSMQKEVLIEELRQLRPEARREILAQFASDIIETRAPHVFLSYSRTDIAFVHDLMIGLEQGGVQVWFDVRELLVGEDYLVATERGLRECDCCIIVVSRYSMASVEVLRELTIARNIGTMILPLVLQDTETVEQVRNLQWMDFRFHFAAPLAALVAQLHSQGDSRLMAQRLRSATKPLQDQHRFIPLLRRSAPAAVRWFNGLYFTGAVFLLYPAMLFLTSRVWPGAGFLVLFAALIVVTSFRVAGRTVTRPVVRSSLWSMLLGTPVLSALFCLLLPEKQRWLVVCSGLPSVLLLASALLVFELSPSLRRWLPARPEKPDFLPAWPRFGRRTPANPAAS